MRNSMKLLSLYKLLVLAALIAISSNRAMAQNSPILSPEAFLGYPLGERFTPHHKIVAYAQHIAQNSEMVTIETIGETYENRPLLNIVITSVTNQKNIEAIRTNNLKRANLLEGKSDPALPGIVWLSYNVHGNEAVSSEAAMLTLYELVNPDNDQTKAWLKNTVVIIDPCLNPDGRERYVNWYNQTVGRFVDVNPSAREHVMQWVSGRTNHYYFDMNRDWAWQTQTESQARIRTYNKWMPQIHVDFHEQGYNEPYYFAPAAEPYHEAITRWQNDFQRTIGLNHANYFDNNNWLYFTREIFDLFYPSYGDTWPTFNGAIGMTYEKGGIRGGLAIEMNTGDTLTLTDRILHHHTTGLSTIETGSLSQTEMVKAFEVYFDKAVKNPDGEYKSYLIKAHNDPDKLAELSRFLNSQGIKMYYAGSSGKQNGWSYRNLANERFSFDGNDLIIPLKQPKSALTRVLFDPESKLSDSLTYDITAWSIPYYLNLDAFATDKEIKTSASPVNIKKTPDFPNTSKPYAYIFNWSSFEDVKFLAALLNQNIKARYSDYPLEVNGEQFNRGSILLVRHDNRNIGEKFDKTLRQLTQQYGQRLMALQSGFIESGVDIGSENIKFITPPKVAIMASNAVSTNTLGHVWHYFDQQLGYPATLIEHSSINTKSLNDFNVLILPGGNVYDVLNGQLLETIKTWVRGGGILITVDNAVKAVSNLQGFGSLKSTDLENDTTPNTTNYADFQREQISGYTPGSIFKVNIDATHPLGYGLNDGYFSLKLSSSTYQLIEKGWNVGRLESQNHAAGFIGYKLKGKINNSLAFGTESYGRGRIVYFVDDPLFRAFWYDGKHLFGNAVFFLGQTR